MHSHHDLTLGLIKSLLPETLAIPSRGLGSVRNELLLRHILKHVGPSND